jgi:hypothetical protein
MQLLHACYFFHKLHSISETLTTHAYLAYKHPRANPTLRSIFEDWSVTGVSLSTGTSPTTESINAVKS